MSLIIAHNLYIGLTKSDLSTLIWVNKQMILFNPKILHFTEKLYHSSNSYQQNPYKFLTNSYLIGKVTISTPTKKQAKTTL